MLCLSGFEQYSRWVPLEDPSISNKADRNGGRSSRYHDLIIMIILLLLHVTVTITLGNKTLLGDVHMDYLL